MSDLDGKSKEELFRIKRDFEKQPKVPDKTLLRELEIEAAIMREVGVDGNAEYEDWKKANP